MGTYSQYRFEDFYRKHGWQGGLTLGQVNVLYETAVSRRREEYNFLAAIHGLDLSKTEDADSTVPAPSNDQSAFLFGDPSQYENMSAEEKDSLTEQMMAHHKQMVGFKVKGKANV